MPGFGTDTFSDEDIANVIAYLKEMAYERSHSSVARSAR
jgi:mono/diheme cytochrome c family protein